MRTSKYTNRTVQRGSYEIISASTNLYLDTLDGQVYNNWCDDVLKMSKQPSRRGKWDIAPVGDGYTIKQVWSGLYCALASGDVLQPVVLSSVPTIWKINTLPDSAVHVSWSVSDMLWNVLPTSGGPSVLIDKSDSQQLAENLQTMNWRLNPVGEPSIGDKIKPGVYSIQNGESGTFVTLSKDEKTLVCSPKSDFAREDTKLWEVMPLGDGYTVRLHDTNKYCTLNKSIGSGAHIEVSPLPAAWKIRPADSPAHKGEPYVQLFWSDTNWTWDLSGFGKKESNTAIQLRWNKDFQSCRLFKLIV